MRRVIRLQATRDAEAHFQENYNYYQNCWRQYAEQQMYFAQQRRLQFRAPPPNHARVALPEAEDPIHDDDKDGKKDGADEIAMGSIVEEDEDVYADLV